MQEKVLISTPISTFFKIEHYIFVLNSRFLTGWGLQIHLKNILWHSYFPVNFAKFLETLFFAESYGLLFLKMCMWSFQNLVSSRLQILQQLFCLLSLYNYCVHKITTASRWLSSQLFERVLNTRLVPLYRRSRPEVFCKNSVLRNFTKCTCARVAFLINLQASGLQFY